MSDCIIWTGARTGRNGYGTRTVDGSKWQAHRYAWTQKHGEIPAGLFVCHRCNNKPCVNVDHLYLANNSQNITDAYRDGLIVTNNMKKTKCPRCGGPYKQNGAGRRVCNFCRAAHNRKSRMNAKTNAARQTGGTKT